jgi:hypothetical protein
MSVLRSIEALSHSADPGVPARGRAEYPLSVAAKGLGLGKRTCRRAKGERGRRAAADIAVGTPRSTRARRLREADHHRERTRTA